MADETLPIRIVETTTTMNEVGQRVSVLPARYVDADTAVDEVGNAIATVPFEEVEGLVTLNSAGQAVPVIPVRIVETLTALNETGASVSVLALRGAGGTPMTPLPTGDETYTGMGLCGITSYFGYYPWANIVYNMGPWSRLSGTGNWSQEWGKLTASDQSNTFVGKICEGGAGPWASLPVGTYTVLNPLGHEIGIGSESSPNIVAFTRATQFTFTYSQNQNLGLHCRGDVDGVRIIKPGLLSSYLAGDEWDPVFMDFQRSLKSKTLRFMDWAGSAYSDISEEWSEVPVGLPMTFRAPQTRLYAKVPYDLMIDLCNRLDAHAYLNVPVRSSAAYQTALAAKFEADLKPSLSVFLEWGNEVVWNFASGYSDQASWATYFYQTRYEAVPNGSNGWTRAAHGLNTGDLVAQFFTKENFTQRNDLMVYPQGFGAILYVERIDADNFKLYRQTGGVQGTVVNVEAGLTKLIYKKTVDEGQGVSGHANYGKQSLLYWQRMDAELGRGRCIHVLATQLLVPDITTQRLAPTGVSAATDVVAVAGYYSGDWWVGGLDITSGQVVPKMWSRNAGSSGRIAIYANGSTPTYEQVLAGTGAGYIGARDLAGWSNDAEFFTSGAGITSLTDGVTYRYELIFNGKPPQLGEPAGVWRTSGTFVASATPSTVTITDTNANMAARARRDIVKINNAAIDAQKIVAVGKPLIYYECGSDYMGHNTLPAAVATWRSAYTQTQLAGDAFAKFYRESAAREMKLALQFVDFNSLKPGVFNLAESLSDTSDYRYQSFAGFNGRIAKPMVLAVANASPPDLATAPAYPSVVYTFPDASLTYRIITGDPNGNFAIVGNELRIINGTGIDWLVPTARILEIEADNGTLSVFPKVSFATGDAWFAASAIFAWDSIADSDNAAINPVIGGNMALTGTAATIASGLWDMGAAGRYLSNAALPTTIDCNHPFFFAAVLDKDNHTTTFTYINVLGGGAAFVGMYYNSGGVLVARTVAGGTTDAPMAAATATGKHVRWAFYDADPVSPKMHAGVDLTEFGTGTALNLAGKTIPRSIAIGGTAAVSQSTMKHGSIQVLAGAGLTLAGVLADEMPKMMAHHGIP